MKYIKYFLYYVELPTKTASLLPAVFAMLYYIFYLSQGNGGIHWLNFLVFFISMVCIDFAVTTISHYIAIEKEKQDISLFEQGLLDRMKELGFTNKTNRNINIALVAIAVIFGLLLVYISNIGILLLGAWCFFVGIFYSFGPKPIARTPLGEVFAGSTQGGVLPVIVLFTQYNHLPFELNPILTIVFMPFVFLIANIMLANNICDFQKDIENNRKTIVYFLKQKKATYCVYLLNISVLASIVLAVMLGYLHSYLYLLLLILGIPLLLNTKQFSLKLSKTESFPFILKNFILFSGMYILFLIVLR